MTFSWAALALGLFGGLHCAGMCGPLVLALPPGGVAGWRFVAGRLVYQAGRVLTYSALGALLGVAGEGLRIAGLQRWTSIAAGVLLIAAVAAGTRWASGLQQVPGADRVRRWMSALIRRRTFVSLAALGALNGLLPCGLVYAAGAGAVASGGMVESVAFMATFGLGTVPTLLAISFMGRLIRPGVRIRLMRLMPASVAALGCLLILRGLGLGIPMISPAIGAHGETGAACGACHSGPHAVQTSTGR